MPMEKQGTVENQLAHTIDQTEYDSRYTVHSGATGGKWTSRRKGSSV